MSELIENQLYKQLSKARKKVIGLGRDFAKVLSANTNLQEQLARAEKVVDMAAKYAAGKAALMDLDEALAKYKEGK